MTCQWTLSLLLDSNIPSNVMRAGLCGKKRKMQCPWSKHERSSQEDGGLKWLTVVEQEAAHATGTSSIPFSTASVNQCLNRNVHRGFHTCIIMIAMPLIFHQLFMVVVIYSHLFKRKHCIFSAVDWGLLIIVVKGLYHNQCPLWCYLQKLRYLIS